MIPAERNLEEYRGDTWEAHGVIYDDQIVPQVVDLQTADIKVQVRKRKRGDILAELTVGAGITVNLDNSWAISYLLDFQGGKHYWDFEVTQQTGKVDTYYAGIFKLIDDVTRI